MKITKTSRVPVTAMAKEMSRGVFWVIDGELVSF